jgi:hypothetical protein
LTLRVLFVDLGTSATCPGNYVNPFSGFNVFSYFFFILFRCFMCVRAKLRLDLIMNTIHYNMYYSKILPTSLKKKLKATHSKNLI